MTEARAPLPADREITHVSVYEQLPAESEFISKIAVGGFSNFAPCNYDIVMEEAEAQARQAGANIVKVIKPRANNVGNCPRIVVGLFRNDNEKVMADFKGTQEKLNASTLAKDTDYAVVHFYRLPSPSILAYRVFHQNARIGRLGNNRKFSYQTTTFGKQTFRIGLNPQGVSIDIQPGKEYYVTFAIQTDGFESREGLRVVDNYTGRNESKGVRPFIPRKARSSRR